MLQISAIEVHTQRVYGESLAFCPAPYLMTLCIGLDAVSDVMLAFPQARAVMDDYGNLVIVRGWI